MRLDNIVYGPHGRTSYWDNYFYNETELEFGVILNDNNDSMGFGFQLQQTGTINSVGMYLIEIEGTPNYAITVTTISGEAGSYGDSYPDMNPLTKVGTLYSNAQWQDFDPLVVGSGWSWIDFATPITGTKGDYCAVIVVPSGATVPDTSNYIEINDESTFWNPSPGHWRYSTYWSSQEWQSAAGLKYSDNTIQGFCITSPSWKEYISPEEWGVEFQLPVQATCVGGVINLYPIAAYPNDAPFKLILADSSDGELASVTILDYDIVGSLNNYNAHIAWDTATDPVLNADTIYRLYLKPTSSEAVSRCGFVMESEASKEALPGGTNWKWIERSTPTSGWTYKADHYPLISVALIDLQSGEGGNGGGEGNGGTYGFIG